PLRGRRHEIQHARLVGGERPRRDRRRRGHGNLQPDALIMPALRPALLLPFALAAILAAALVACAPGGKSWSESDKALIVSLSLSNLGALPPDPSNRVA